MVGKVDARFCGPPHTVGRSEAKQLTVYWQADSQVPAKTPKNTCEMFLANMSIEGG